MPGPAPTQKLDYLLTRLISIYGRQGRYSSKPPLDQLMATILSQRTTYADERKAYTKLLDTYGDWQGVAAAPVSGIEECILSSRWPEVKAPRIKQILNSLIERYGEPTLDFLSDMETKAAQDYLMELPGVGFKSATFVLLFSLRKPVVPVDTHVHRVSIRYGLLPPGMTQAKAHTALLEILPNDADELLNFHKLLFKHGQRICTWSSPRCENCVVAERCDFARERGK